MTRRRFLLRALQCVRFEDASDDMPSQRFPTLDVWQQMSESEQDSLIAKMERRQRWHGRRIAVVVVPLLMTAAAGAFYLL
jgi:hypothetical protein